MRATTPDRGALSRAMEPLRDGAVAAAPTLRRREQRPRRGGPAVRPQGPLPPPPPPPAAAASSPTGHTDGGQTQQPLGAKSAPATPYPHGMHALPVSPLTGCVSIPGSPMRPLQSGQQPSVSDYFHRPKDPASRTAATSRVRGDRRTCRSRSSRWRSNRPSPARASTRSSTTINNNNNNTNNTTNFTTDTNTCPRGSLRRPRSKTRPAPVAPSRLRRSHRRGPAAFKGRVGVRRRPRKTSHLSARARRRIRFPSPAATGARAAGSSRGAAGSSMIARVVPAVFAAALAVQDGVVQVVGGDRDVSVRRQVPVLAAATTEARASASKYKTEVCRTFAQNGTCPYGTRCRFIHQRAPMKSVLGTLVAGATR